MTEIKTVQWVSINSVLPWKENPRKNDEAAKTLSKIIEAHGIKSPLVAWSKNKVVYKGNTTLKACKLLKRPQVPVAFVDFKDEAEAIAYALADNKASEFADWDDVSLAKLLTSKSILAKGTGFTNKEILGITWQANLERLNKIEENDSGLMAKIVILCNPADKAELINILKEWSNDSGFENIQIDS